VKEVFQRIWEMALPYQDKRDDEGHAETTLDYAKKLVEAENGDEDIVIPAIILHDIGWSKLPQARRLLIFDREAKEEERQSVRLEHQREGVKLAREILNKVGYPSDMTEEILEIISRHDTREGFISKNEGLVRDADKLWRFSKGGLDADARRYKGTRKFPFGILENSLQDPNFLYSKTARQIAIEELELRKNQY